MKKVNIVLVSTISLLLYSTYGIARTSYSYTCKPGCINPGENPDTCKKSHKCCVPIKGECGADTKAFEANSSGLSGGGKHNLQKNTTKYISLNCGQDQEGKKRRVSGYNTWKQSSNIHFTQVAGDTIGGSSTVKVNVYNAGTKNKKFGIVSLGCSGYK